MTESATLELHFMRHLEQAFRLKSKPFQKVPDYTKQIKLLYDTDSIVSFLDQIKSGTIAFDYETNMLKPESEKARIVSVSVCWNGVETAAFPLLPGATKALCRLLKDREVKKIAQNMKFEDRWTRTILGVQVRSWRWDTMLAAHVLDCRSEITGLKFTSFVMLGQPRYDLHIEPYLKQQKGGYEENKIDEIPLDKLLVYNGLDSLLEYLLAEIQMTDMKVRH
jgi:DNA polymerase I-like protein with 3'-5' exonuclease and polymerase domains